MNRIGFTKALGLALLAIAALPTLAPAAACAASTGDFDANGLQDIRFTGNAIKQTLVIDAGAASTTVSLDCNGNGLFTDPGDLNAQAFAGAFFTYDVQLGGTDIITFNLPGDWTGVQKALTVNLGAGINSVTINGAGATLHGDSRLAIDIAGNTNIDRLSLILPGLDASGVVLRADLNFQNDEVNVTLGGDLTNGAVVDIDTILSLGTNSFTFTQPAARTITGSTLSLNVEGAEQIDYVTTNFNGTLQTGARVLVNADLGNANDKFTGNFDLASFDVQAGAEARFDVLGGGGGDILTFTRNSTSGGAGTVNAGLLDIRMDGGTAVDVMSVDLAGGGFQMNGGTLAVRAIGGPSNDRITLNLEADAGSSNPIFDVAVSGSPGADTLSLTLNNNSPSNAADNYGPAGVVILDGSWGTDACTATGNGIVKLRNCP